MGQELLRPSASRPTNHCTDRALGHKANVDVAPIQGNRIVSRRPSMRGTRFSHSSDHRTPLKYSKDGGHCYHFKPTLIQSWPKSTCSHYSFVVSWPSVLPLVVNGLFILCLTFSRRPLAIYSFSLTFLGPSSEQSNSAVHFTALSPSSVPTFLVTHGRQFFRLHRKESTRAPCSSLRLFEGFVLL